MTEGERIAATTSRETNRAELARQIDNAISKANADALLQSALRSIITTIGPCHQTVAELACKKIAEKALRTYEFDGDPCPMCGNEEHHLGTGMLTCECPAPIEPAVSADCQAVEETDKL